MSTKIEGRLPGTKDLNSYRKMSKEDPSSSDNTVSTLSFDDIVRSHRTADACHIDAIGADEDLVAIKRMAQVIAKRRQIDTDEVVLKLTKLFKIDSYDVEGNDRHLRSLGKWNRRVSERLWRMRWIEARIGPELIINSRDTRAFALCHCSTRTFCCR